MNHNLVKKREKLKNKMWEIKVKTDILSKFIEDYETIFIEDSSISALIRIKSYLKDQKERLDLIWEEYRQLEIDIEKTCNHEIVYQNYDNIKCAICGAWFFPEDVNFNHILLKNDRAFVGLDEVYNIVLEMANKGEEPIDTFEEYFDNNLKLVKTKIYKRRMAND